LKFKISNVTNLQDARYSAAVGFDYISFNLIRGNPRKLEPPMIWNLVNWLEGPEFVLESNQDSMDELKLVGESFHYQYINLPLEDWNLEQAAHLPSIILIVDNEADPVELRSKVNKAQAAGLELKFEVLLKSVDEIETFSDIFPHIFINLQDIETLALLVKDNAFNPYGVSLREEAEEKDGLLDFERIDKFWETVRPGD